MWCSDPDGAFDSGCRNLGCEDWCKDNSCCPLQRKDQTMYILSKKNFDVTKELDESAMIIQISKDEKSFTVLKHTKFPASEGNDYHISQLKHILMAGN
jgi:hypothetical protein